MRVSRSRIPPLVAAVVFFIFFSLPHSVSAAEAVEWSQNWDPDLRGQPVYVYFCSYQYASVMPEISEAKLINALMNGLHAWKHYSQVVMPNFLWGGAITSGPDANCESSHGYIDGTVYIRAFSFDLGSAYAHGNINTRCNSSGTAGYIQFYGGYNEAGGGYHDWDWTVDTAENKLNFQTKLIHEFGHVTGCTNDEAGTDFGHNSVFRYLSSMNRMPWHEDILQASTDDNDACSPDSAYPVRAGYRIRQKTSTEGITWNALADNLNEYTNDL